jgi:uncharacterized membrane protein
MSLDPLLSAPWHIQVHAFAAIGALLLGIGQLAAPKGTIPHRTVGYVWVALMIVTVVSASFIRSDPDGAFSWIHILIPITALGTIGLVFEARRSQTRKHRNSALVLFFAALLIPGILSFMPGRIMLEVVLG